MRCNAYRGGIFFLTYVGGSTVVQGEDIRLGLKENALHSIEVRSRES